MHHENNLKPFKLHTIHLQPEDIVYIFSDGYVDQTGGKEGKKFKMPAFKKLLINIHTSPMEIQKSILENTLEAWRNQQIREGVFHEQTDDIIVMGLKM